MAISTQASRRQSEQFRRHDSIIEDPGSPRSIPRSLSIATSTRNICSNALCFLFALVPTITSLSFSRLHTRTTFNYRYSLRSSVHTGLEAYHKRSEPHVDLQAPGLGKRHSFYVGKSFKMNVSARNGPTWCTRLGPSLSRVYVLNA